MDLETTFYDDFDSLSVDQDRTEVCNLEIRMVDVFK
jgi:hypothetical protein